MKALLLTFVLALSTCACANAIEIRRPHDGDHSLRILDPKTLELAIVTRKQKGQALPYWDAVDEKGFAKLPPPAEFRVMVNGEAASNAVVRIGYKRRPLYAPLGEHDLRVGTQIYTILDRPLKLEDGDRVEVTLPNSLVSPPGVSFSTDFQSRRNSPAIHINQVGYQVGFAKQAMVGYYLGDAGELSLENSSEFFLRDMTSGKKVHSGTAKHVRDAGFPFTQPQYQRVLTVDFSEFDTPGRYTLGMEALGESQPFTISDGLFACIARTYALGIYHQRSGVDLELPYSRFTHRASHTRPVKIPDNDDEIANSLVDGMAEKPHADQKSPELTGYASSLYPIKKRGTIDASGGHHDAGDYSKYTSNCAQLIHHLMFAHDALEGVSGLDNLGLPESGDGIGDLMQIALHEANFLAKLQDEDGGFFFLVYPDDRKYEDDIAPDEAGGQIVFPKNTAATAAASAALAQIGGSPHLQKYDKVRADQFIHHAEQGWTFLEDAWKKYGRDGAYQRISHYGDIFMDRDEIIWAATELYLATKDSKYHEFLLNNYIPAADETRRWGWQRLFEGYGAAARSYAYATISARAEASDLDPNHHRACQREVWGWGKELANYADQSAYGLSFPSESKAYRAAGWYFPISDTLDLVAASAQSESRNLDRIILSNFNYELGTNPSNTCFLTGLGSKRPFEIVHQWARNDDFQLPMTGIPVGALVSDVPWIGTYEQELGSVIYPSDGDPKAPYAFYDRITDTFNVATEFVTYQQGRALAASAYMMARTSLAQQAYTHLNSQIKGAPSRASIGEPIHLILELEEPGLDLADALIVWEARGMPEPYVGAEFKFAPQESGPNWATAEAQWPDGRRAFARTDFSITASNAADPIVPTAATNFYFSSDSPSLKPGHKLRPGVVTSRHTGSLNVSIEGAPSIDDRNLLWMREPKGGAIRFDRFEDQVTFRWKKPAPSNIEISGWFYIEKFPHAVSTSNLFALGSDPENQIISLQFDKWAEPASPQLIVSDQEAISPSDLAQIIHLERWHKITMRITPNTWQLLVDGIPAGRGAVPDPDRISSYFEGAAQSLTIGHFIGIADELHVSEATP